MIKKPSKIMCVILTLFVCMNNYAAVVGDNDGAAFITKAEFESLKSDFASQIDRYNQSIDSKIDGKIASYLDGIKVEKMNKLKCLLDENGKYGNKYTLYWSGSTSKRVITDSYHYALYTCNYGEYDYDPTDDSCWGGLYKFSNIHNGATGQSLDKYNVCRYHKIYKDDGVTLKEIQLEYEKVKNSATFQLYFQFPCTEGSKVRAGGTSNGFQLRNLLELNSNNMKQVELDNKVLTYFRKFNGGNNQMWSVWKQCYATILQEESATDFLILAPFSTQKETVWDLDDYTLDLQFGSLVELPAAYPYDTPASAGSSYKPINIASSWGVKLQVPYSIWFPWQLMTDTVNINQRKIKNLIDIDDKNGTAKNGVVIGTIPEQNGDISITLNFRAEALGTVYVYVGDDAIDNWTSADFKGKKVNITAVNKKETIKYDDLSKNQKIWLFFKNNASGDARVFIDSLYVHSVQ